MEVAIVLPSHRGRAAKLAVVLRVLTKPEAAHSPMFPQQPQKRRSLKTPEGCRRRAAISQANEVVEEKSVTTTTTVELRKYMSERAIGFDTGPTFGMSGSTGCPRSRAFRDLGDATQGRETIREYARVWNTARPRPPARTSAAAGALASRGEDLFAAGTGLRVWRAVAPAGRRCFGNTGVGAGKLQGHS